MYDRFFKGEDEEDRQYLLLHGGGDVSDDDEDDDDGEGVGEEGAQYGVKARGAGKGKGLGGKGKEAAGDADDDVSEDASEEEEDDAFLEAALVSVKHKRFEAADGAAGGSGSGSGGVGGAEAPLPRPPVSVLMAMGGGPGGMGLGLGGDDDRLPGLGGGDVWAALSRRYDAQVGTAKEERGKEEEESSEEESAEEEEADALPNVAALKRLTVVSLRELLSTRGLPTGGKKEELIQRLDECRGAAAEEESDDEGEEEERESDDEEEEEDSKDAVPDVGALKRLTVACLRELLSTRGLPTEGKKDELIQRLDDCRGTAEADEGGANNDGAPEVGGVKRKRGK